MQLIDVLCRVLAGQAKRLAPRRLVAFARFQLPQLKAGHGDSWVQQRLLRLQPRLLFARRHRRLGRRRRRRLALGLLACSCILRKALNCVRIVPWPSWRSIVVFAVIAILLLAVFLLAVLLLALLLLALVIFALIRHFWFALNAARLPRERANFSILLVPIRTYDASEHMVISKAVCVQ
jgi:hypothetical protein